MTSLLAVDVPTVIAAVTSVIGAAIALAGFARNWARNLIRSEFNHRNGGSGMGDFRARTEQEIAVLQADVRNIDAKVDEVLEHVRRQP